MIHGGRCLHTEFGSHTTVFCIHDFCVKDSLLFLRDLLQINDCVSDYQSCVAARYTP